MRQTDPQLRPLTYTTGKCPTHFCYEDAGSNGLLSTSSHCHRRRTDRRPGEHSERRNHQLLPQSVRRFRDERNLYCSEPRNDVEWDEYNGRGVGSVIGQEWQSAQGERNPCPKKANMLRYMRTCEGLLTVSGLERKVAKPGFSQAPAASSRCAFKARCRENASICLSRDLLPLLSLNPQPTQRL